MINLKNLVAGSQLTASTATYYTATNVSATIKNATATNTTAAAETFTVYIVPAAGSADATKTVIDAKSVAAHETYNCPELIGKNIPVGGTIQAKAGTTTVITLMISGLEVT